MGVRVRGGGMWQSPSTASGTSRAFKRFRQQQSLQFRRVFRDRVLSGILSLPDFTVSMSPTHLLPGDAITFEQERDKWSDWPLRLVQPTLPVPPFPVQSLLGHSVLI